MNTTIIIWMFVVLGLIEVSIIIMFFAVCRCIIHLDHRVDKISSIFSKHYETLSDSYFTLAKLENNRNDHDETNEKLMNTMLEAYQKMYDGYMNMSKLHVDLLKLASQIDEHWNGTDEQFDEIAKGIADIYAKINEPKCMCHVGEAIEDPEEETA